MTTDEKLQHFMEVSVNTASAKCQNIIEEYKAGMDKIYEDHKKESIKNAETLKKTTMAGMRRNLAKDFARQQQHIRRKLTHKQEELKDALFQEVLELLIEFKRSPDYEKLLVRQIKGSLDIAKDQDIYVYISPEDEAKLETLKRETGARISVSDFSFLGGTRAEIPAKNILIDNSFSSRFASTKNDFVMNFH